MARFRKKQLEVEAMQFHGLDSQRKIGQSLARFLEEADYSNAEKFVIHTLEGDMEVSPGDWVIKGIKGEFYPCKNEIFLESYEPVL